MDAISLQGRCFWLVVLWLVWRGRIFFKPSTLKSGKPPRWQRARQERANRNQNPVEPSSCSCVGDCNRSQFPQAKPLTQVDCAWIQMQVVVGRNFFMVVEMVVDVVVVVVATHGQGRARKLIACGWSQRGPGQAWCSRLPGEVQCQGGQAISFLMSHCACRS